MNKIILTLNHHKVIDGATEKIEEHLNFTFEFENELPKYLDYLRLYLEDKLSKLSQKIGHRYFGKRKRSKSKSNTLDTSDR